jgi:hypothetical protein
VAKPKKLRKVDINQRDPAYALAPAISLRSRPLDNPTIPTGNLRHTTAIRRGSFDRRIFSRRYRESEEYRLSIGLSAKIEEEPTSMGGKEDDNAQEVVQQRRKKSPSRNAKAVRKEEGRPRVLREGKQVRSRKKSPEKDQQHVQQRAKAQRKAAKQPPKAKKKVSNTPPIPRRKKR